MSIKAAYCLDVAPGETRMCLLDAKDRPFRLEISRQTELREKLRFGDHWWVRAVSRMPGGGDWFAETGSGERAVLSPGGSHITEGQLVPVMVVADSYADKGARLRIDTLEDHEPTPEGPGWRDVTALNAIGDPFHDGIEWTRQETGAAARAAVDAAIEEGLAPVVALAGGGDIAIEGTRALTAVDIDRGGAAAAPFALNKAAAREIARQIGLRSIGGLVVIDFVTMPDREDRARLIDSLRSALSEFGVAYQGVSALSRAGLCEIVLPRGRRPLADAVRAPDGEREGLDAVRAIQTAGWAEPGRRIHARVGAKAEAWLARKVGAWEYMLTTTIGPRWVIESGVEPRGPGPEVWAER